MRSVGGGTTGCCVDTADTGTGSFGDLDVAGISPSCTPGVLNERVCNSIFSSVTNSGDCVVCAGGASGSVKDAT